MRKILPIIVLVCCWSLIFETNAVYKKGELAATDIGSSSEVQSTPDVEDIIQGMTLHEKVCQMFFVKPEELTGVEQVVAAGEITANALKDYPVGGIIYSKPNMTGKSQLQQMIMNTQEYSQIGLFIAADEEGGIVNRLMNTVGTTYIDSMYTYKNQGTQVAYDNAGIIAGDMHALGFNLDFAPVADVWSNKNNTVIGQRAYSDDYGEAAELITHAVAGFHAGGVLCTLKHFPGHGDTSEDSHYSSAFVNKTKEQLMNEEFVPFKSGIEAGADFVMVGHLIVPDIDEQPATLSQQIIQGILREELGFDGVIITDSLSMSALAGNYSCEDIAVKAVEAGNDMLLEPENISVAVSAVKDAVERGDIYEERIDESVRRILNVKIANGLLY